MKKTFGRQNSKVVLQLVYWIIMVLFIVFFRQITGSGKWWIPVIAAILAFPYYKKLLDKYC